MVNKKLIERGKYMIELDHKFVSEANQEKRRDEELDIWKGQMWRRKSNNDELKIIYVADKCHPDKRVIRVDIYPSIGENVDPNICLNETILREKWVAI